MGLELGAIVEARVTGITKFGAFVSLPEGKSGLVHISEIANCYVNDVSEHVSVGQTVKVLVMNLAPDGKINLSIKRAQAPQPAGRSPAAEDAKKAPRSQAPEAVPTKPQSASPADDFEDRLKKFMRDSDSRIADNKMYSEHRQRSRRR